jgi:hypothetical protein
MVSKDPLRGPISSGSGAVDVDVDAAGMEGVSEDVWAMGAGMIIEERLAS